MRRAESELEIPTRFFAIAPRNQPTKKRQWKGSSGWHQPKNTPIIINVSKKRALFQSQKMAKHAPWNVIGGEQYFSCCVHEKSTRGVDIPFWNLTPPFLLQGDYMTLAQKSPVKQQGQSPNGKALSSPNNAVLKESYIPKRLLMGDMDISIWR